MGNVDGPNNGEEASDEEGDVPRTMHTKVDIVQDYLEQSALPGKQLEPRPVESTVEAQYLRAFLGDMEKTAKVFLSSYMRDTGLIWSACFVKTTILSDQSTGQRRTCLSHLLYCISSSASCFEIRCFLIPQNTSTTSSEQSLLPHLPEKNCRPPPNLGKCSPVISTLPAGNVGARRAV